MRACAPIALVLLLASAAFADEPTATEAAADPAELAALEARVDDLQAELSRELEARIERQLDGLLTSRLDVEGAQRAAAPRAGTVPAALASQPAEPRGSQMRCAIDDDSGSLDCTVLAEPADRIAHSRSRSRSR